MDLPPSITNNHGRTGLLWLFDQAKRWHLSDAELATVLGFTETTLNDWSVMIHDSSDQYFELPESVVERIGLLLALHRALVLLAPVGQESMAAEWIRKPTHLWGLNGASIRSRLIGAPSTETLATLVRQIRSSTV